MRPDNADTAKGRILEALQRRPHTAVELSHPSIGGLRYSARIMELRTDGYVIVGKEIKGKSYQEYHLMPVQADKRQIPLF